MNIILMLSKAACCFAIDPAIVDQIANKKQVSIEDIKTMNKCRYHRR